MRRSQRTDLDPVDEFGQRDVASMTKDVDGLKRRIGAVLEFDP
jgi:hypothetical protein